MLTLSQKGEEVVSRPPVIVRDITCTEALELSKKLLAGVELVGGDLFDLANHCGKQIDHQAECPHDNGAVREAIHKAFDAL